MARRFHEAYERLAPTFGYTTRQDTREWSPESTNGQLMIAVCEELAASAPALQAVLGWRVEHGTLGPAFTHHEAEAAEWKRTGRTVTALIAAAPSQAGAGEGVMEVMRNLLWAAQERDKGNRIRQFDEFVDDARAALSGSAQSKEGAS